MSYHRELVVAALSRCSEPVTAARLTEVALALAIESSAGEATQMGITARRVAALCRNLEMEGVAVQDGTEYASKQGREMPKWRLADELPRAQVGAVPTPPPDLPVGSGTARDMDALLADFAVDAGALLARHMQDVQALIAKYAEPYQRLRRGDAP